MGLGRKLVLRLWLSGTTTLVFGLEGKELASRFWIFGDSTLVDWLRSGVGCRALRH